MLFVCAGICAVPAINVPVGISSAPAATSDSKAVAVCLEGNCRLGKNNSRRYSSCSVPADCAEESSGMGSESGGNPSASHSNYGFARLRLPIAATKLVCRRQVPLQSCAEVFGDLKNDVPVRTPPSHHWFFHRATAAVRQGLCLPRARRIRAVICFQSAIRVRALLVARQEFCQRIVTVRGLVLPVRKCHQLEIPHNPYANSGDAYQCREYSLIALREGKCFAHVRFLRW